ncbi:hypothetical protein LUZ60_015300 [Juncus effusus]|nr:hypothetical protein LUZ60_015300 [Juncus effusus]
MTELINHQTDLKSLNTLSLSLSLSLSLKQKQSQVSHVSVGKRVEEREPFVIKNSQKFNHTNTNTSKSICITHEHFRFLLCLFPPFPLISFVATLSLFIFLKLIIPIFQNVFMSSGPVIFIADVFLLIFPLFFPFFCSLFTSFWVFLSSFRFVLVDQIWYIFVKLPSNHAIFKQTMRSLSSLGIGLAIVSILLFFALVSELYYIFYWRKRRSTSITEPSFTTFSFKHLFSLLCFKHPNPLQPHSSLNPHATPLTEDPVQLSPKDALLKASINGDEALDVELMRLHSLSGPPRFLFTIKEESKEDLESDDGRSRGKRSRNGSRGRSLGDLLHCPETPLMTPLASPPLFSPQNASNAINLESFKQVGINPLFESSSYSPPPKFKFLKDAEEKLQRSLLEKSRTGGNGEEEGSYVTIVLRKAEREEGSFNRVFWFRNGGKLMHGLDERTMNGLKCKVLFSDEICVSFVKLFLGFQFFMVLVIAF